MSGPNASSMRRAGLFPAQSDVAVQKIGERVRRSQISDAFDTAQIGQKVRNVF